ncbi:ribosome maturation factor RimM [Lichenibacterium dinghuense]|uniref:ribosome maturation factor RimM n=1 Tax=Lichenibacterium dinghuense TaxID=2895977 RepID=UPI001EED65E1|nr:ribosome maturation factor RimM [Lichenibacterium sp. 6Y81]
MGETRVLVGVFGAPQGVRGEVRIKSYTGEPRDVGAYGPLTTADGRGSFKLLSLRPLRDDMLVARVEGIEDRDAAARLTNTDLYIPRDRLPPPEPDEFYHVDLVGLRAEGEDGAALGRVRGIENHGAGDIVEIAPDRPGETLLVPFTLAFVPVIDFEGGRIVVAAGALLPEEEGDATVDDA